MQRVVLPDVDLESVVAAVGATSYAKGTQYVRRRAVVSMAWDAARSTLHGTVRGREDHPYSTEAFFSFGDEYSLEFVHGQCSCPVGYNCKHVAALILAAASPGTVPLRSSGDYPAAHVRLLQQMYAAYRASAGQGGYSAYPPYGDGKSLDFSAFESPPALAAAGRGRDGRPATGAQRQGRPGSAASRRGIVPRLRR